MSVAKKIELTATANYPQLTLTPRRCKIIATVGPASNLLQLVKAGTTAFRLNFSHGSHEEHRKRIEAIREVEKQTGQPIPSTGTPRWCSPSPPSNNTDTISRSSPTPC